MKKGESTVLRVLKIAGLLCRHGYNLLMYPGAYVPHSKPEQMPTLVLSPVTTSTTNTPREDRNGTKPNDIPAGGSASGAAGGGEEKGKPEAVRSDANTEAPAATTSANPNTNKKTRFNVENLELRTKDGVKLRAYLTKRNSRSNPPAKPKGTILFFHGNHATPERMSSLIKKLITYLDFWVLAVTYRGFGHSEGSPSERGLCADAQAALDYVLERPELGELVVVYGYSLGGAVAIDLVSRNADKVDALIIDNTFTSIPKLMSRSSLLRPFLWTIRQKWESYKKLWTIRRDLPILMLSGIRDEIVPAEEMMVMYEIAKRRPGRTEREDGDGEDGGREEKRYGLGLGLGLGLGFAFGSCWGGGDDCDESEDDKPRGRSQPVSSEPSAVSLSSSSATLDAVEAEARRNATEFFGRFRRVHRAVGARSRAAGVPKTGPAGGAGNQSLKKEEYVLTPEDEQWYREVVEKWNAGPEHDRESGVQIKHFPNGKHGSTYSQPYYTTMLKAFLNPIIKRREEASTAAVAQRVG